MIMKTRKTLCYFLVGSLCMTTGCVNNTYDLTKDVDMTVTLGGDLVTPGNSTEEIKLEKILKETSEVKITENGDYQLEISGEPTSSSVNIESVNVERGFAKTQLDEDIQIPEIPGGIVGTDHVIEAPFMLNPTWTLKNTTPVEEIRGLRMASNFVGGKVSLNLKLDGSISKVTLKKGLSFQFPRYLVLKDVVNSELSYDKETGKLTLVDDCVLDASGITWMLELDAIYFEGDRVPEGEGFDAAHGSVTFNASVPIEGVVSFNLKDLLIGTGKSSFNLLCEVETEEMQVRNVEAKVDPKIEFTVNDIEINDLPDFLTDNDVKADLYNPQILLSVNNPSVIEVNFQGNLKSYKKENLSTPLVEINLGTSRNEAPVENKTIILKGGMNKLCLCPHNENIPEGYQWIQVAELPSLISKIPDVIKVDGINAEVLQKYYNMELGRSYDIQTDYDIQAPLTFGKDFQIVYKDTASGWDADLKDYKIEKVEVTMDVDNQIPLLLDLDAAAVDKQGNIMSNVHVDVVDGKIEPGKGNNEPAVHSNLSLLLTAENGKLKDLDGIVFTLKGNAADKDAGNAEWTPKALNANQTIKLYNLRLRVKGGLTVDLN